MTECNAIIEANNEIDKLKRENKKLNALCVEYGFEMGRLEEENEQLKKELSEYKDFVLSDDKILCYTCLFCTHKGIYEVDCDIKGHVDVHGSCLSYTKKEVKE